VAHPPGPGGRAACAGELWVGSGLAAQDPTCRLLRSRGHREVSAGQEGTGSMASFLVKGSKKQRSGISRQPVGSNNDINSNNNKSLFPTGPHGAGRADFEDAVGARYGALPASLHK